MDYNESLSHLTQLHKVLITDVKPALQNCR